MQVPPLTRGVLIAVEGIDGSGKTTQAVLLERWAIARHMEAIRSREPTSGPWGKKIKESRFSRRMSPSEELECFLNDRREHVATLIAPALARNALVIVDRYYYSTVAYQGARGLDPTALLAMNREFAPVPDLVLLLELEARSGLERIHRRGIGQDLFEDLEKLARSQAIFQSLREPHVRHVNADRPMVDVHRDIIEALVNGPLAEWATRIPAGAFTEAQKTELLAPLAEAEIAQLTAAG